MIFTTISSARKDTGLSYLGNINSSSKIIKNTKVSGQYTYILYLAPAQISGYNTCSHSTLLCRSGCLATSGRAGIGKDNKIQQARIKKTKLFFEEQDFFMQWMIAEIKMFQQKAIKDGYGFSVRLNGTSDIDWQKILYNNQNIFDIFPNIQFYDYTKNINKFLKAPTNYHLTYSYTGENWSNCLSLLEKKYNVAVIFNINKNKQLPSHYKDFLVIDGDLTDFRPNDPKGVIVGLRWKRIQDSSINNYVKHSAFVIQ